jgi:NADPH:quinone reductase-like Zn-dependent oxidoreductase
MRAYVLTKHGGPEVLQIADVPKPEPKAGEVRVRIRSIGLNFAEVLSRRGLYSWAPKLPYILGMEAFGEIDGTGEPVIVGTQYGTYAEYICVPRERAVPAIAAFSPDENAAFLVGFVTAWVGLMEMARLRPTDTVLITSAAGGVGSAAVQIAKKFGARVIGAAGNGKQDAVLALGADEARNYNEKDWDKGMKPDVVLEMTGGDVYKAAVRRIAPMGRIVVAGASGVFPRSRNPIALLRLMRDMPKIKIADLLMRSYGVMSFHVGRLLDAGAARQFQELTRFAEEHGIRPLVGPKFEFDDMANAQRALEDRRNIGKVVVRVAN